MQKFLNTLWEFTRGKKGKDNFIQKTFKVCKVFKVKPLITSRPDVPSKKTAYNLFCKDIQKIKKELQGVPVYKASAIISKKWKKVKVSSKKMKKYRDLYKEEKLSKSDEPRRVPGLPELADHSSEEEQGPKKASRTGDGKKSRDKGRKKGLKDLTAKKSTKVT